MKNIKLMNKIAPVGIEVFDKNEYNVGEDVESPIGIMVRSADLQNAEFGHELRAIARAGAGVNNIPVARCAENGIVVFNTPGANANGVKELTVCALLLASRGIVEGVKWAQSLAGTEGIAKAVEKGKSAFAGCEITGKKLGVIGLGAIGGMVANTMRHLGMNVIGHDPYLSVDAAWNISRDVEKAASYDDIYKVADYITLHVPSTPDTKGMINAETIAKMKDGVRIVNLARGDLVNMADMKAALESGKVAAYVTDFPTEESVGVPGVITIPHLGASTAEAEENCAVMAAKELTEFLENGNIKNSVNFPNASMPHIGDARICIMHTNTPNMLASISAVVASENLNIENLLNRSKGEYAYTMIELNGNIPASVEAELNKVPGVIRVSQLLSAVLVIGGRTGSFLGEYQAGGIIVVLGIGSEDRQPVGNFCGTGMHGGRIYLRTAHLPKDLPEQVVAHKATEEDMQIAAPLIQNYAEKFGADAESLLRDEYYVLRPNTQNPYKQLYVTN